jgi:hypothetical protein
LQQEEVPATTLEALDRDWTAFALVAEKACQTYPSGPYSQEIAQLRRRKTVISHLISSKKKGISFEHAIRHLSSDVTGLWPMSLEDCQKEYQTLVKKIKDIERYDQGSLCKKELWFQMDIELMAGDRAGAKGIKNILKAEERKEMLRQLKWAKPQTDAGITAVRVPTDGDYSTDHCKKCDSWQTLDDPTEVQVALQHQNQVHFGQAHGTFPTTPQFTDHINWMASTISSDMIMKGENPFEDIDIPDIARELLASFVHSSPLDAVSEKSYFGQVDREDEELERNNLNEPKRNASRTSQNIDQTISSQQSTSQHSTRVTRIRVSAIRRNTGTSGPA